MGYRYDDVRNLCCDQCGKSGGVRERKCPYKVLGHSLNGPRQWLPYCHPLAPCGPCYTAMGGEIRVHAECRAAAAASQAANDEIERQLDAGRVSFDRGIR